MNLALCGLGKAGTEFIRYLEQCDSDRLVAVLCRDASPNAGKFVSELTKIITPEKLAIQKISEFPGRGATELLPDVIIDFSASQTTFELLKLCLDRKINLVICPTDFTDADLAKIKKETVSGDIGVIYAPALTPGVNLLMHFVEQCSKNFPEYQFEIIEKHPLGKSSPSRTAGYIQQAIKRPGVPVHSVRLNGFTGVHEVIATDGHERISITHESFSRSAFARGALKAARFIYGKKGFYTLNEILRKSLFE